MGMKTPFECLVTALSALGVFGCSGNSHISDNSIWVADYRVHSNRIDQMERGVALEPENASAWDRLAALERQISQTQIQQERSQI